MKIIKDEQLLIYYVKLCEELGELIQAASKVFSKKWKKERLIEEIADVEIMIKNLKRVYGIQKEVHEYKKEKLRKLK